MFDEPYRFGFFQAVRLLENWFATHGGARPRNAVPHHIDFRTTLATAFPPSEIEHASPIDKEGKDLNDKAAQLHAIVASEISRATVTPALFGLLGSQGALPLRYTEQVATDVHLYRDRASQAFFDIFSNRATALFYAAWKKYRLPLHYELDRNNRYRPILHALAGVADHSSNKALHEEPGALADDAVAGYSAAVRHRAMSAVYLQRVLSDYFGVPIRVEQFISKKYVVPPSQQSSTGSAHMALGSTAIVGAHVWLRHARVRLVIGPLSADEYEEFLPRSRRSSALTRLLQLLVGVTLEFEVQPVLRREEVKSFELGLNGRLNCNAFLATRPSRTDRSDLRYTLNKLSIIGSEQDLGSR
ncbi:type VI secretion system baseplate subunit TssG [Paraburkholderia jirisanensis]